MGLPCLHVRNQDFGISSLELDSIRLTGCFEHYNLDTGFSKGAVAVGQFSETLLCLDAVLQSILRSLRSVLAAITCTRLWSMECLQNIFQEGK